jgi:hypothetical protein
VIVVLALFALPDGSWAVARPKWTRTRPHFEIRNRRVFAVAVGKAQDANEALATAAAEERARASLLRLLQGKSPGADVMGEVKGARVVEVWRARGGIVYARLEVDTSASPQSATP